MCAVWALLFDRLHCARPPDARNRVWTEGQHQVNVWISVTLTKLHKFRRTINMSVYLTIRVSGVIPCRRSKTLVGGAEGHWTILRYFISKREIWRKCHSLGSLRDPPPHVLTWTDIFECFGSVPVPLLVSSVSLAVKLLRKITAKRVDNGYVGVMSRY